MLLFTLWLMHDCAALASHASLAALHAPFGPHVFRDNPSANPRLRKVARWVQEIEESGTDSESVVEEASNYVVRRLRNRRGKESGTDSGRRMDFEGGTRIGDHLGSPRVAPRLFDGHP